MNRRVEETSTRHERDKARTVRGPTADTGQARGRRGTDGEGERGRESPILGPWLPVNKHRLFGAATMDKFLTRPQLVGLDSEQGALDPARTGATRPRRHDCTQLAKANFDLNFLTSTNGVDCKYTIVTLADLEINPVCQA
mgnify:CR=1 FL=1